MCLIIYVVIALLLIIVERTISLYLKKGDAEKQRKMFIEALLQLIKGGGE